MTDMPTTAQMRAALHRWQSVLEHGSARDLRSAGAELAGLLERVATVQEEVDGRPHVAEEYAPSGLPRRAAERARKHGAVLTRAVYSAPRSAPQDTIMATFPNGSRVWAMTRREAEKRLKGHDSKAFMGKVIASLPGATPGANPPLTHPTGMRLVDVLNAFADREELRY
jgi:hypothetical protein